MREAGACTVQTDCRTAKRLMRCTHSPSDSFVLRFMLPLHHPCKLPASGCSLFWALFVMCDQGLMRDHK